MAASTSGRRLLAAQIGETLDQHRPWPHLDTFRPIWGRLWPNSTRLTPGLAKLGRNDQISPNLARTRPTSTWNRPSLTRNRPKFADCDQSWPEVGSNSVEVGPESTKVAPKPRQFAPTSANFDQHWPRIDQHLPGLRQCWLELGQQCWIPRPGIDLASVKSARLGRVRATLGRLGAVVGRIWPRSEQLRSISGHLRSIPHQIWSNPAPNSGGFRATFARLGAVSADPDWIRS